MNSTSHNMPQRQRDIPGDSKGKTPICAGHAARRKEQSVIARRLNFGSV